MRKNFKNIFSAVIIPSCISIFLVCGAFYFILYTIRIKYLVLIAMAISIVILFIHLYANGEKVETIKEELRALKLKFLELPEKYVAQRTIEGFGDSQGLEIIRTISGVCNDVVGALISGRGVDGSPINKQQIANGLKRLIADARTDLGIVAMHINPNGVQLYQQYLKQLDDIADRIINNPVIK